MFSMEFILVVRRVHNDKILYGLIISIDIRPSMLIHQFILIEGERDRERERRERG